MGGPVDGPERLEDAYPAREADPGLRIAHRSSGFSGRLVGLAGDQVTLRGNTGLEKSWKNTPGAFLVDGVAVRLVPVAADTGAPKPAHLAHARVSATQRTASGSRAVIGARARVAQPSRILVEGVHDAALVEKVWGDDLRIEGIVVERLDGADQLDEIVRQFDPMPGRRLGVLLDHLVVGSKETRLAESARHPHVLVTGHPYVDVWQAIRPAAVGIRAWPEIPQGTPWKEGICASFGVADPADLWRRLLARVNGWRDLEPVFVGAVEQLIDFVTAE
jgi:hypothetical protein